MFHSLVEVTQIQDQRPRVEDLFLLGLDGDVRLLIEGLHQQPQQILPEDIPVVFLQVSLTQLFIAEG